MRPGAPRLLRSSLVRYATNTATSQKPLVHIQNGTFYRRQPVIRAASSNDESDATNRPLFPNLDFSLPSTNEHNHRWAVVGPSNAGKTTFLEILQGQYLCFPPTARSWPFLSADELIARDPRLTHPSRAFQYVGFSGKEKGLSGMGTYLSARYESRKEETDFLVLDYLKGNTQLNASDDSGEYKDLDMLDRVIEMLSLQKLVQMPLSNLSNGQTRRARIAKALLGKPEVLLLDEPFMGLDPPTTISLSPLLRNLAEANSPRLILTLRPQDPVPDWITHLMYLGQDLKVTHRGPKAEVAKALEHELNEALKDDGEHLDHFPRYNREFGHVLTDTGIVYKPVLATSNKGKEFFKLQNDLGESIILMEGVQVRYGDNIVLGDWDFQLESETESVRLKKIERKQGLWWNVRRGQRWAIFGPNGSGKTTLLSLITSDHPQSYALPVKHFGRSRLPTPGQPGISLFDIQRRIGHCSPEVHSFFPRHLSVRATLESAFADTPLSKPTLTVAADERIDAALRWFQGDLNPTLGTNPELLIETLRRGVPPLRPNSQPDNYHKWKAAHDAHHYALDAAVYDSVTWADTTSLSSIPTSAQRVVLFLRALVAEPDIVILDEAFSGLDDTLRDKCLLFLEYGESRRLTPYEKRQRVLAASEGPGVHIRDTRDHNQHIVWKTGVSDEQALIVVSHVPEEVPRSVRNWLFLPEAGHGEPARMGYVRKLALRHDQSLWAHLWAMKST